MTRADLAAIARGLAPILRGFVSTLHQRIAALEATPRGLDGAEGKAGEPGAEGPQGAPGRDGRDGLPGRAGEKGADGRDGVDGLGFDDIQVEFDGERSFTLRFVRGDQVKSFGTFTVPSVIYRGVFSDGQAYQPGDAVTWGGAMWIAKDATRAKPGMPGEEARAWQLAVKKGADGKQGPSGPAGPRGPIGGKQE